MQTNNAKRRVGRLLGLIKSVQEFLSDAVDGFKDTQFSEAISAASPWAEVVGEVVQEALPPIKFFVNLFEKLTKDTDPEVLGILALTTAYEKAVERAIEKVGAPQETATALQEIRNTLEAMEPSEEVNIDTFSLKTAITHEFVRRADQMLRTVTSAVGYSEAQINDIEYYVHKYFAACLKTLLSKGETMEKFAPFTEYLKLGSSEVGLAYQALRRHAELQRRKFENAPVFGREPFALTHVYVDTECGQLAWGDINKDIEPTKQNTDTGGVDPFSEKHGGRYALLDTVMDLIGDPNFNDAIVIQGVAGAGKSAFTLRLCVELLQQGLRPIRVRLKDLNLFKPVDEALPEAVILYDPLLSNEPAPSAMRNLFLNGDIFRDTTEFRGVNISRYVLILDGWDEISISATEGFQIRVEKMLEQIRYLYLDKEPKIRVILTGRPSDAVTSTNPAKVSTFLHKKTMLLTLRPMHPDQLEQFADKMSQALTDKPVISSDDPWSLPDNPRQHFHSIFDRYRQEFKMRMQLTQADRSSGQASLSSHQMDLLGLPLLAHLALRLLAQYPNDPSQLIENPTTLYRYLVDLTSERSGKPSIDRSDEAEIEGQYRFDRYKLRSLLQRTAVAMTVTGQESISFQELKLRLKTEKDYLTQAADEATRNYDLSTLMISFFFKEGHDQLGCEFLHKSFREYLIAEFIIETLKDYGRKRLAPNSPTQLLERSTYWKDFENGDLRHELSRNLAKILAPHWLTPEVVGHLRELLFWEIVRVGENSDLMRKGTTMPMLEFTGWSRVRDGLADLWDWWAEGVHLRPQPVLDFSTDVITYDPAYVVELVKWSGPQNLGRLSTLPIPPRIVTLDAHMGDALLLLCAEVHYRVAEAQGIHCASAEDDDEPKPGPRRCQTSIDRGNQQWIRFAPTGGNLGYFKNYAGRINSAGWRYCAGWDYCGEFPSNACLKGVDLKGVDLFVNLFHFTDLSGADLRKAHLAGAHLWKASLSAANLSGADLWRTNLSAANFEGVNFSGANLEGANLWRANFSGANFSGANLSGANLWKANFSEANLSGANLSVVYLLGTNLENDNRWRVNFSRANLEGANLEGANLEGANLEGANLEGANLEGANLEGANLEGANLEGAKPLEYIVQLLNNVTKTDMDTS